MVHMTMAIEKRVAPCSIRGHVSPRGYCGTKWNGQRKTKKESCSRRTLMPRADGLPIAAEIAPHQGIVDSSSFPALIVYKAKKTESLAVKYVSSPSLFIKANSLWVPEYSLGYYRYSVSKCSQTSSHPIDAVINLLGPVWRWLCGNRLFNPVASDILLAFFSSYLVFA